MKMKSKDIIKAPSEHEEQAAFIQWCNLPTVQNRYPELAYIFAIPNGGKRTIGTAVKMKAEGVKRGVPDLMLPVPRGDFFGLFLETKVQGNYPTKEQVAWQSFLMGQNYAAFICYGYEELVANVQWYLALPKWEL